LRGAVRVLLASRQPLALWWGVECTLLFNDACRPLLGSSADNALGMPAPSAWLAGNSQISAIVGEGPNCREGHFALALNPVPGDGGALGGVLCTFVDVTRAERAEQDLALAETLQEIIRDLSSELELDALMQKVTDAATRLTGAAFGAFFHNSIDAAGEIYQLYTLSGAPREAFSRFGMPRATPVFKPTFDGEDPVRVADITQDPRYGKWGPHHGQPKGHLPVRSYLAVPVVSRNGEVLGGLFFGHPDSGVFGERAERNAVAISSHAAIAIDNARNFARARQELERRERIEQELAGQVASLTRLHDLALRLGGMNELQPALEAILDTAVEGQDADFGLVWLQERESGALVVRASRGFDGKALQHFQRVMPGPGGGAAGNAFAQQRRWVIEDVDVDPGFEPFRNGAHDAGFRAIHSTPIVTRSGQLLGAISVHFARKPRPTPRDMQVADVCARHAADAIEASRSQEALRESERVYRAIGESIDHGVWICDAAGRTTYASESFLRMTGLSMEQCGGNGWIEALHPDEREHTAAAWKQACQTGGAWDVEHRFKGVDGKYHAVLARGVPVRDDAGRILAWAGINLNIDRMKQVERELRELDQRKNEFLATLAHELRNPLAPLRNGLEVLRLAGSNAQTAEKARTMMERQLGQMVRLVDDLLDVSRVSRGKIELRREDVELATVLRNAIETSQPLINERRHELRTSVPAEGVRVNADVTRLSQVFWNLLNNAAKYTEPGGRIEIVATVAGDAVEVSVRDNGVGIPPDMQSRVFDIFTQVDRTLEKSQGGLGIGLSIAKRLVEMHGGSIHVDSAGSGRGSEFVVRLPARVHGPEAARPSPPPEQAQKSPSHRILIADDNRDSATTLAILLEAAGNQVRVAHDGSTAIEVAAEYSPDVVLLDIGMPRLNGYDACRIIRAQPAGNQAYIVALTGWGQPEDRKRAQGAGFDCHLVKPVEPAALEQLIRELPQRTPRAPAT
jgi:PAS domain S-box-containing protein